MSAEVPGLDPPFRWPGGKRRLLEALSPHIPASFGRYFEPFLGGGALFFRLTPTSAFLSDHNEELINFYTVLRDRPRLLARLIRDLSCDRDTYYRVRRHRPIDEVARAARFAYLTTLAFNGIYRVNRNGRFNTPYGGRRYGAIGEESRTLQLSAALQSVELKSCDFAEAVGSASEGDLVYLDPPYTVAHQNNGFLRYNEKIFSFADQARLAGVAESLRRRGVTVIVSNAYHESVRTLYDSFDAVPVGRKSSMAADASKRRLVEEYIFVGRGHHGALLVGATEPIK